MEFDSELRDKLEQARALLAGCQRVAAFSGAGLSAESGLATFRGAGGLWEGHRVEDVATPEAYERDPELVHRFYNERRRQLLTVEPNDVEDLKRDFEAYKTRVRQLPSGSDDAWGVEVEEVD